MALTGIEWTLEASISQLTYAFSDSLTVPIWFTFSSRQLQAFSSTAFWMRVGLVTVRSSPTTWMSVLPVKLDQASQSSWSKGSSIETTGSKERRGVQQCSELPENRASNIWLYKLKTVANRSCFFHSFKSTRRATRCRGGEKVVDSTTVSPCGSMRNCWLSSPLLACCCCHQECRRKLWCFLKKMKTFINPTVGTF